MLSLSEKEKSVKLDSTGSGMIIELTPFELQCKRVIASEADREGISVGTWFTRNRKITREAIEGRTAQSISFSLDVSIVVAKVGSPVDAAELTRLQYTFQLPQTPGYYLWHRLDLSYLDVGVVQVTADKPDHIWYLQNKAEKTGTADFLLYRADDGAILSMYHEAHDHKPPTDARGRPIRRWVWSVRLRLVRIAV